MQRIDFTRISMVEKTVRTSVPHSEFYFRPNFHSRWWKAVRLNRFQPRPDFVLVQGCPTRGPRAACGRPSRFVRSATRFGELFLSLIILERKQLHTIRSCIQGQNIGCLCFSLTQKQYLHEEQETVSYITITNYPCCRNSFCHSDDTTSLLKI